MNIHYQPGKGQWNLSLYGSRHRKCTRLWTLEEHLLICQVIKELRKLFTKDDIEKVSEKISQRIDVSPNHCARYLKRFCKSMEKDLSALSFRDEVFLISENGLRPDNVMEYFYQSPFYIDSNGASSINEMVRRGTLGSFQRVDGEVYSQVHVNKEESIFVIQKCKQISSRGIQVPLMTFYIISGTIYLAPGLGQLLEAHLTNSILEFENMFDNLRKATKMDIPNEGGALSPVSTSSFRAFSRNFLSKTSSQSISEKVDVLTAPIMLVPNEVDDNQSLSIDKKVRLAEDRLGRLIGAEETKFSMLSETVRKLFDQVTEMKIERETYNQRKENEMAKFRADVVAKVNQCVVSRESGEERNGDKFATDINYVVDEVKKLRANREESQGKYARKIGDEVAKISAEFQRNKQLRVDLGERMASTIQSELIGLDQEVRQVKSGRLESENEMIKMIEEMCLRIRSEIDNERLLREHGEEQLLQLLEETCNRVEANFQVASIGKAN